MNINETREMIREEMELFTERGETGNPALIPKVQQIFKDFPELKRDRILMREIYKFSVKRGDSKTAKMGRKFIFSCLKSQEDEIEIFEDFSCLSKKDRIRMTRDLRRSPNCFDVKKGVLLLSENKLVSSDQLWNFVEKHPVNELVVRFESGSSITYSPYMLDELVEKKPDIKALTEMITVKFWGKPKFELPIAKLLLCGNYFDTMFSGKWNKKEIDFETIHPRSFSRILEIIETGEFDYSLLKNEGFVDACNFLLFSPPDSILENALGPDQWREHFGDVGEVPPLPSDLEVGENQLLVLIPKTVNGKPYCLDELKRLLDSKEDPAMKFAYYHIHIREKHGSTSPANSYWIVMDKNLIDGSLYLTRDEQKAMVEEKGCRLPKILEVTTAIFMHYAVTGGHILSNDDSEYTCCEELVGKMRRVVQCRLSYGGLNIIICHTHRNNDVGVAALREV
jgi:hypothetical protein